MLGWSVRLVALMNHLARRLVDVEGVADLDPWPWVFVCDRFGVLPVVPGRVGAAIVVGTAPEKAVTGASSS